MNIIRRPSSRLSTYRPRIEDEFGQLVESLFDEMLAPFAQAGSLPGSLPDASRARIDVREMDGQFEVQAELPGVKKEDVKVVVSGQRVTIEAESKRESERREGENMIYSERSTNKFARSFTLPVEVDEEHVEARMDNGILTLNLPRKQGKEVKRIAIQ